MSEPKAKRAELWPITAGAKPPNGNKRIPTRIHLDAFPEPRNVSCWIKEANSHAKAVWTTSEAL